MAIIVEMFGVICANCEAEHYSRDERGFYSDRCRVCDSCAHCGREDGLENSGNRCRWTDCPSNIEAELVGPGD